MIVVALTAILCCVALVWSRLKRPRSPPSLPGALPLIGHAHQVYGDRKHLWNYTKHCQRFALSNGGVTEGSLGGHSVYMLTDPEDSLKLANTCLNKPYVYYFAKDILNDGLLTSEATKWKTDRKLINPAFNQQVLNTYVNEMSVQARTLVSRLAPNVGKGPFDVHKYLVNYTLSVVTRTSLGLNNPDQTKLDTEYAQAIEDICALYCDRFQKIWLHSSFLFDWSEMKRIQDQLTNKLNGIIDPVIQKRKSELKANNNLNIHDDSRPGKFNSLLDQILLLAEEQGAFTDVNIREHLNTLVAASYDTTSVTLQSILIMIGSDPKIQDRIFKELQEVLVHEDNDLTKEDLPKLVYLEAVIKETMRLYPVVPIIARKLEKDIHLKNYTLRAGRSCLIGVYGLLRHPMWGADAEQFRPERWLNPDSLPHHPSFNAFFGVGKRNCLGKVYGMMVIKTALAHILRRYHVTGNINNVVYEFGVMLKAVEGHLIELTPRT